MEGLFDIIFKNPFLLLLLVGGVISLLRRKRDQGGQQDNRTPTASSPASDPHRPRNRSEQTASPIDHQVREPISTLTIEEHREKQMERFGGKAVTDDQYALANRPKVADAKREVEVERLSSRFQNKQFKRKFKKNLTREGLIDSIVMAEVLGSPRSRKPYQNIVTRRRNK